MYVSQRRVVGAVAVRRIEVVSTRLLQSDERAFDVARWHVTPPSKFSLGECEDGRSVLNQVSSDRGESL